MFYHAIYICELRNQAVSIDEPTGQVISIDELKDIGFYKVQLNSLGILIGKLEEQRGLIDTPKSQWVYIDELRGNGILIRNLKPLNNLVQEVYIEEVCESHRCTDGPASRRRSAKRPRML